MSCLCNVHLTSHGYWTYSVARGACAAHPRWAAFGALLPDLPAGVLTVGLRATGRSWRVAGDEAFHKRFEPVHRATHSAVGVAAVAVSAQRASRRLAVAAGWAGHLLVDLVTHHADARPPAWPLSHRVWRSPVSHWEADHHAAAWNAVDAVALAMAAYREGGRAHRLAALVAAAVAVAGLWEAVAGRPLRLGVLRRCPRPKDPSSTYHSSGPVAIDQSSTEEGALGGRTSPPEQGRYGARFVDQARR